MIPRTFPSSVASNGSAQMIVYFLPSVSGLTRWVDYIPVKFTTVATAATENTYNQNGYIPVVSISSIAGATPFKEYVPVYLDSSATDAEVWKVNITGFIPVGTAGIGGAALYMDFAATTTLDPRITFSRTTNATLTNSAGLVATAPMNLLTFSEQFDNAAWTKSGSTITANAVAAPDGTLTADALIETATTGNHQVYRLPGLGIATYTYSVYAKANGRTQFVVDQESGGSARFTLSGSGTAVALGANTVSIVALGNGWYRCSNTFTVTGAFGIYSNLYNGSTTSYTGDGISGIYLWGAQLELGSTATTYNPTTVKNLLGFTENFDNAAWTKSNASITSGFTDIYGQPFAQKLVESAGASSAHYVWPTSTVTIATGTTYTVSVYAKAGERSQVVIEGDGAAGNLGPAVFFNLANGTIISGTGGSITSIGNGWYRCQVTAKATGATAKPTIFVSVGGTAVYTGDGTSGIYIFGAQLSDSASVDPYVYNPVAAPTAQAYYGPRFDYDPVTLAPKGLLIEEQRTNLLTYSEQFDNAAWGKNEATVVTGAGTSPNGTQSLVFVRENTANGSHSVFQQYSSPLVINTPYTASFYIAKFPFNNSRKWAYFSFLLGSDGNASKRYVVNIDLLTGTVTDSKVGSFLSNTSTEIVNAGSFWRVTVRATPTTSPTINYFILGASNSATPTYNAFNDVTYTGDGTSGIYIWGAQLEAGAFATSYIPTVASQVTRAADSASMIGNNFARWYTQGVGTLFSQFDTPASGNRPVVSVDDNTANNMIRLRTEATDPYFRVVTGGAAQADLDVGTVASNTIYKMAGGFGSNSFLSCINAGTVGSDTSGTVPIVDRLRIGSDQAGAYLNGHIARTSYYGRVLTATEDQGITS